MCNIHREISLLIPNHVPQFVIFHLIPFLDFFSSRFTLDLKSLLKGNNNNKNEQLVTLFHEDKKKVLQKLFA